MQKKYGPFYVTALPLGESAKHGIERDYPSVYAFSIRHETMFQVLIFATKSDEGKVYVTPDEAFAGAEEYLRKMSNDTLKDL